jgi:hypothetical protein
MHKNEFGIYVNKTPIKKYNCEPKYKRICEKCPIMQVIIGSLNIIQYKIYSYIVIKNILDNFVANVIYTKIPNKLYTVIMIDINAAYEDINYLHQITINNCETIVPYIPPKPPANTGNHSYLFLVLTQTCYLKNIYIDKRANFPLDIFISDNKFSISRYFTFIVNSATC